jgi:hypothetical protein
MKLTQCSFQIRALSLHYEAPIMVIQAGTEAVEHGGDLPKEKAMFISCVSFPYFFFNFKLTKLRRLVDTTVRCTVSAR